MTTRQRSIIWAGAALSVLSCLYPPWHRGNYSLQYSLIFHPPISARVDFSRLSLEWIAITVVFLGLYFAWPWRKGRGPAGSTNSFVSSSPSKGPRTEGAGPDLHDRIEAARVAVQSICDDQIPWAMVGEIGKLLREVAGRHGVAIDAFECAAALARERDWYNWRNLVVLTFRAAVENIQQIEAAATAPKLASSPKASRRWPFANSLSTRRASVAVLLLVALGIGLLMTLALMSTRDVPRSKNLSAPEKSSMPRSGPIPADFFEPDSPPLDHLPQGKKEPAATVDDEARFKSQPYMSGARTEHGSRDALDELLVLNCITTFLY